MVLHLVDEELVRDEYLLERLLQLVNDLFSESLVLRTLIRVNLLQDDRYLVREVIKDVDRIFERVLVAQTGEGWQVLEILEQKPQLLDFAKVIEVPLKAFQPIAVGVGAHDLVEQLAHLLQSGCEAFLHGVEQVLEDAAEVGGDRVLVNGEFRDQDEVIDDLVVNVDE